MATAAWVVVIEAGGNTAAGGVEVWRLRRLLEQMPGVEPVGLHSAERVAVQVQIDAPGEVAALHVALAGLRAALPIVGLPDLDIIRAEVLTRDEYERDCRLAYGEDHADGEPGDADGGDDAGSVGEQLLRQAFEDPLTQLPGRDLLMDHLERALVAGRGMSAEAQVVAVLQLAGLDAVNERYGRSAGDEVLVASARRLRAALPASVKAGRIGGNDFAVLLGQIPAIEADAVVWRVLEAMELPVLIGDTEVAVAAHAGIARSEPDQGARDLIAQARAAARVARERAVPLEMCGPGMVPADPYPEQGTVAHNPMSYVLLMQRAAMASNECATLEQAAGLVVSQVCAHLGFELGHLYVAADGWLVPGKLARSGASGHDRLLSALDRLRLGPGEGPAGRALESGQPAWVTDIAGAPSLPWSAEASASGLNAAVAFPVLVGREVVAVLEFFARHTRGPNHTLVDVLRCIGSQLGRVVERERALASLRRMEEGAGGA